MISLGPFHDLPACIRRSSSHLRQVKKKNRIFSFSPYIWVQNSPIAQENLLSATWPTSFLFTPSILSNNCHHVWWIILWDIMKLPIVIEGRSTFCKADVLFEGSVCCMENGRPGLFDVFLMLLLWCISVRTLDSGAEWLEISNCLVQMSSLDGS